jgi:hypothetical protein
MAEKKAEMTAHWLAGPMVGRTVDHSAGNWAAQKAVLWVVKRDHLWAGCWDLQMVLRKALHWVLQRVLLTVH